MIRSSFAVVTFAAVASVASVASAQIELANSNRGFEDGTYSGWAQFPTAAGQQTIVAPGNGPSSFAARINNVTGPGNSLFKMANVGIGIVTPGQTVTIKFDARGSATAGGVSFAEFFTEIAGGGTSSNAILGGAPLFTLPGFNANTYTTFTFNQVVGANASGGVTLQLGATTGAAGGSTSEMFYDNISITVIPEPVSLGVVGSAGALLLARRRRAR